jgi:hypothetical protein
VWILTKWVKHDLTLSGAHDAGALFEIEEKDETNRDEVIDGKLTLYWGKEWYNWSVAVEIYSTDIILYIRLSHRSVKGSPPDQECRRNVVDVKNCTPG